MIVVGFISQGNNNEQVAQRQSDHIKKLPAHQVSLFSKKQHVAILFPRMRPDKCL